MRLYFSPTSPYARKARIVAREKGLTAAVTEVAVNPHTDPDELIALNPLGRVPTLVLDNGRTLYDSPVICGYLDDLGGGRRLHRDGPGRWEEGRRLALADGILDSAIDIVLDSRRPEDKRDPGHAARRQAAIRRALDALEAEAAGLSAESPHMVEIATACVLGYLDLRQPVEDWRPDHPGLSAWFAAVDARPAFAATRHVG